ncbi:MAG TPA: ATP-binding cassette domain-containing protein, partial [Jiangellaceae bacterium]|nr:ATP-binding cassette domain-containing protein [Jiangellaceae bacterium]
MITAHQLEVRAGAQILLQDASFRVAPGDKVGLVGRNGAGKTTLTRILAGDRQPAAGSVTRSGDVGYLPQDPRIGDPDELARDRILGARGLDVVVAGLRRSEQQIASADADEHERGMRRYARLDAEFLALGGYAAESEAATIAASLGLPERVLTQPLRT